MSFDIKDNTGGPLVSGSSWSFLSMWIKNGNQETKVHALLSSCLAGLSTMVLELTQQALYCGFVSIYMNYMFQTSMCVALCPLHLLLIQSFSIVVFLFFLIRTCRHSATHIQHELVAYYMLIFFSSVYLILGLIVMLVVLETFCELQQLKQLRKMFYLKKEKQKDRLAILEHDQLSFSSVSKEASSNEDNRHMFGSTTTLVSPRSDRLE